MNGILKLCFFDLRGLGFWIFVLVIGCILLSLKGSDGGKYSFFFYFQVSSYCQFREDNFL